MAERIARSFVASDGQQQEKFVELVVVELFAVHLGGQQCRQDVVGEPVLAPLGDQFIAVGEHFGGSLAQCFGSGRVVGVFDAQASDGVAPPEHFHPVLARYTEHVGDHLERNFGGNIWDSIEFALGSDVGDDVEEGQLLGARLVDQLAVVDMTWRVDAGQHRRSRRRLHLDQGVALAAAVSVGVAADQSHVGVFCQQPRSGQAGQLHRMHRRGCPQPRHRIERGAGDEGVGVEHRRGVAIGGTLLVLGDQRTHRPGSVHRCSAEALMPGMTTSSPVRNCAAV